MGWKRWVKKESNLLSKEGDGPDVDGVESEDNVHDDGLDAWNAHVMEVELATDSVVSGFAGLGLFFVRAGGEEHHFEVPFLP